MVSKVKKEDNETSPVWIILAIIFGLVFFFAIFSNWFFGNDKIDNQKPITQGYYPTTNSEASEPAYNSYGISKELQQKTTLPYLEYNSEKIDCSNSKNYDRLSLAYSFYISSKWIPSTKEGTFYTDANVILNNGCTNLYPHYITQIVFNSLIIEEEDSLCDVYDVAVSGEYVAEPLRPTETLVSVGAFMLTNKNRLYFLSVNQTGNYFIRRMVSDCKTNQTLVDTTIKIKMGDIIQDYYNKVDLVN